MFQRFIEQGMLIRAENDTHTFRGNTHTSMLDRAYVGIHPGSSFRMDVYWAPLSTSSNKSHKSWHYPLAGSTHIDRAKGVIIPDCMVMHPDFNELASEAIQEIRAIVGEFANPLCEFEMLKRAMREATNKSAGQHAVYQTTVCTFGL